MPFPSILHASVHSGSLEMLLAMQCIINEARNSPDKKENSLNVDMPEFCSTTPLMYACLYGLEDQVIVLLSLGKAKLHAKDNIGWTCIHYLAKAGNTNILKFILEYKTTPKADNITLMHESSFRHYLQLSPHIVHIMH